MSIDVGPLRLSALTAGSSDRPAIVLLHGWPLCSAIWNPVMEPLSRDHFVVAFDLPGTGQSAGGPTPTLKADIAETIIAGAEAIGAKSMIVAGVDVGGMVAFAAARDFGDRIAGAVIINTVLPGLDPWEELLANPQIWHFTLHQLPDLPEKLVTGRERSYFDFFLDTLAGDKTKIDEPLRQAASNNTRPRQRLAPVSIGIAPCLKTPSITRSPNRSTRPSSTCAAMPIVARSPPI